jgi:hypothetical protein
MKFDKAVNEVKDRLETVGERSQGVAKVSLKAFQAANEIVISSVQDIVTAQTAAAKDLFSASKESIEKAVAAGLVAVVKNPVEYIPDGRDTIVGAFNETIETVAKTGEKLVKVVKNGYEGVAAQIAGKPLRASSTGKKARAKTRKVSEHVSQTVAA